MKLYRIAGHSWAGTQAEAKAVAKEQGSAWTVVDVPIDKPGLLAWLNDEANVVAMPATEPEILDQLEGRPWIKGPATKDPPRISPAFLGALDGGEEFIPVSKAAEIDRLLKRCPKCHGGAVGNVLLWIGSADVQDLERVMHAIVERTRERELENGGAK